MLLDVDDNTNAVFNQAVQPGIRLDRWTHEEDAVVRRAKSDDCKSYAQIAKLLKGRSPEAIRSRYVNHLDPSLDRSVSRIYWTDEEKSMLLRAVKQFGTRWSYIANTFFPGKSEQSCRNVWYNQLRKQVEEQEKADIAVASAGV